jgi:hypothetical protein
MASIVLALLLLPLNSAADTIVLKNGRKVDVEMAWIEEGQVKGVLSGAVVTYPQSAVERIDQPPSDKAVEVATDAGFRFGIWTSGMTLADVRRLADEHALALSSGRLPEPQDSAAAMIVGPTADFGTAIHYRELLLEKSADVEMRFTPDSRRLFGLTLRWMGADLATDSDFFETVYSNLSQKYGRPNQKESKFLSIVYHWKIDKRCWVDLESGDHAIEIRYMDTKLEKAAIAEHQSQSLPDNNASARP